MPAQWPSTDQSKFITGNLLADPLVQDALAYVQSVVPADLLSIPTSTYISLSTVKYNSDVAKNCYWPGTACVRSAPGNGYQADVYACPQTSTWGISFDDGPTVDLVNHQDSLAIRQQLDKMKIKGTFFVVGSNVIQNPQIVLDEYNDGQQIGVHTWTHHPLTTCTNEQIVAEIKYSEALIYNATGHVPKFFRPPYGDVDDRVRSIVNALGYSVTIWSKDDFAADQTTTSPSIAASLENTVISSWFAPNRPGFISLSHDISPFTSGVILSILQYVQQNRANISLNIVPIGTCMNMPWYVDGSAITTTSKTAAATNTTTLLPSPTTINATTTSASATASPTTSNVPSGAHRSAALTLFPAFAFACACAALAML
ncbi:uncharacterized protein BJ171DRAFT_578351 [Polychytrium aggregatum]|uniref:uncharacterized protein n=1 Tax=Polychytrium aggregatum TaxID=110093 RepID=UPI0022FE3001|nr:uncharacterized protein BJ171DRAFT_578351 [Polychytrium aggregatum]KAI9207873.1 hypothetical protein BJ171DRAFT_578351 [Polychytrium aggregatum]